jgi:hypothetical protein
MLHCLFEISSLLLLFFPFCVLLYLNLPLPGIVCRYRSAFICSQLLVAFVCSHVHIMSYFDRHLHIFLLTFI